MKSLEELKDLKKLNLGAGNSKITGAINCDAEESTNPDIVCSLKEILPFEDNRFSEVYLFHCIEHIEKYAHSFVLSEIWRVMEEGGMFYISFPEFSVVANNWINDKDGKRDFWEKVLYGRQLYPGDYHVAAMDSQDFKEVLFNCGFEVINISPEIKEVYNTVIKAKKSFKPLSYEEIVYLDVWEENKIS